MFKAGERVFVPGASGEPAALTQAVFGTQAINITTSFAPGVNRLTSEMLGEGTIVTGLFMQPGLAAAQREGRFRHIPQSYAGMIKYLRAGTAFDACVVQVAPPDDAGNCALGSAAEFLPEVLRRVGRIVAVINPNVPRIVNAPVIAKRDIAQFVEAATPLITYDVGAPDAASLAIAGFIASQVPDGAVLQTGLGKVPQALMAALCSRRGLRLHSGMISDGMMALAEAGALDPDWPHCTTAILGSTAFYAWVQDRRDVHLRGVEHTHDPAFLAGLQNFIAVNSGLEVDLFGQCNLEIANGRAVSGFGGAPDFARAARLGQGGLSIVALPASFGKANESRIKARLGAESIVSLPRSEADMIVTEHGLADLRGLSVHERAAAIIAVAAPDARALLETQWREIAARL